MADAFTGLAPRSLAGAPRSVDQPALGLSVVPASDAEDLIPRWVQLSLRAVGDNVFFHPDFAIPAMRRLAPDAALAVVRGLDGRVAALAPFVSARLGRIAPAVRLWAHDYAPFGLPLVDRQAIEPAVATLLEGLAPKAKGLTFIAPDMPMESPVATALIDAAHRRGRPVDILDAHGRGALARDAAGKAPDPRHDLATRRRKEYARQLRRLSEIGEVKFVAALERGDVEARFEQFLALEAKGWKGRRGTALTSHATTRDFARAVVTARATAGQARIDAIELGGRPIAMVVSFAAGSGAWTWKIAYDEEWSRFSPGAQLMLDVVKAIFSDETITAIDSCATADHPLIDHIWSGRLAIGTIVIGPPEGSAVHTVGLAAARAELAARAAVRRFV
jgi:CelD/BcsL family acetyltransferase involved in cellulose biosynthesis